MNKAHSIPTAKLSFVKSRVQRPHSNEPECIPYEPRSGSSATEDEGFRPALSRKRISSPGTEANPKRQRTASIKSEIVISDSEGSDVGIMDEMATPTATRSHSLGTFSITPSTLVREARSACEFACPYCPSRFLSSACAYAHIKTKHVGMSHTWDVILRHAVHIGYHECVICRRIVVADSAKIKHHLVSCHGMKISDYRKLKVYR